MSDQYEIMTLVDSKGDERGAVFVNTATKRVLDLEVFQDAEEAEAFEAWLKLRGHRLTHDSLVDWLNWRQGEWTKAKQQSALAAYGEAIDVLQAKEKTNDG